MNRAARPTNRTSVGIITSFTYLVGLFATAFRPAPKAISVHAVAARLSQNPAAYRYLVTSWRVTGLRGTLSPRHAKNAVAYSLGRG